MDLEAAPIQVQTPPKEEESENSEDQNESIEPILMDEKPADEEEAIEPIEEKLRDDEIVVENAEDESGDKDGIHEREDSPLSDLGSDAEPQAPKNDIAVEIASKSAKLTEKGLKLGDVLGIKLRLEKKLGSDELLKSLHRILYKRPGVSHEVKKNIRDFSGFHFADNVARQAIHDKLSKLMITQLKEICALFGLQVSGTKDSLTDALVEFLDAPWDTKKTVKTRRSSIKVVKPILKKKSSEKIKSPKSPKRKSLPAAEPYTDEGSEDEAEDEAPPLKKSRATPVKSKPKPWPKSKPKKRLSKVHVESTEESSDDDVPLRPGPSDSDIKSAIFEFLKGKDLSTVTKGMVKEALRAKYGEAIVKTKRDVITSGIQEGMEAFE